MFRNRRQARGLHGVRETDAVASRSGSVQRLWSVGSEQVRRASRGVRIPGLRTFKVTLAAVLAFVVAQRLHTSAAPVLAPLTALLVVQLTLYETVTHGIGRIVSVVVGVLLSVGIAASVGLTWWSIGGVVGMSLVVGRLLRLGSHLLEVPITAMIVLASVGTADRVALGRVYETLIGAAVGLAVNVVLAPPLYLQPAGHALAELSWSLATYLRGLAAALRQGWSREAADHWLDEARALGREVEQADRAVAMAEQSAQFNPRGRTARTAQPRLRTGLTGLEHAYVSLRSLARALLDRTYYLPADEAAAAYGPDARAALAHLLDLAAGALNGVAPVTSTVDGRATSDNPGLAAARDAVRTQLDELRVGRDRLAEVLTVDPGHDPAAWQQHGALLASLDRLRVEVEAAVRPPQALWRPPRVTDRPLEALRRATASRPHDRPPRHR